MGFPGGSDGEVSVCNAGDPGSIPGLGRFPGEGNGSPLQYSCLENPMDGGIWWATVHGVAKGRTRLGDFTSLQSSLELMSIVLMMPCNHFILCCLLLLLPSIFPSIRVFSNESALHIIHLVLQKQKLRWSLTCIPIQFSSIPQSCPTLCDPVDCSPPGFPVHHQLPQLTQTHVP